eukprot:CAMPEP_0174876930 /NCGR_PEP_ID=MMETSP1114-20130205/80998_1 /TAXON_ID=312471 /ORGANISM="Neobodo designis, Strain CCAP 1951/1" /LENGTH=123 /DNA_ID=CAMNT_0016112303 /DNA_START=42 /DNA_END=413 /DNA_ORIENTATION=+
MTRINVAAIATAATTTPTCVRMDSAGHQLSDQRGISVRACGSTVLAAEPTVLAAGSSLLARKTIIFCARKASLRVSHQRWLSGSVARIKTSTERATRGNFDWLPEDSTSSSASTLARRHSRNA